MIPQKNEKITLITLNTRERVWVVKGEVVIVVEDVVVIDNAKVLLTATVHGRQFYCERTSNPSTLDELRASVWRAVVSARSAPCPHHLFVEAVTAFNVNRAIGKKSGGLVCNRSLQTRTAVVPHAHNSYCPTHDRAYYWGERCPKCPPTVIPTRREMQAA